MKEAPKGSQFVRLKEIRVAGKPTQIRHMKCCGRLCLIYKRDRHQFCCRCDHEYDFDGKDLGWFGGRMGEEPKPE